MGGSSEDVLKDGWGGSKNSRPLVEDELGNLRREAGVSGSGSLNVRKVFNADSKTMIDEPR